MTRAEGLGGRGLIRTRWIGTAIGGCTKAMRRSGVSWESPESRRTHGPKWRGRKKLALGGEVVQVRKCSEESTTQGSDEMAMYRQGDVLIRRVAEIPEGTVPVKRDAGRVVLAYGEVTGHAHAMTDGGVELLEAHPGRYLRVTAASDLRHEEHATIRVDPGVYEVVIQREYDDVEEWRQVAD